MNCNQNNSCNNEWEERISLHYSADEIDAAISKVMTLINKVDETLDDSIVQLKDGNEWKYPENANPVYPLTKASAVFFDNDITKTLDKKIKFNNSIFDVSLYNDEETYESLELALHSIPVEERKSGMFIKFINNQNNYEVWRYLKSYKSTIVGNLNFLNITNWQGIKLENSSIYQESNPILSFGTIGIEIDTNLIKVGDGVTEWNELPYIKVVCKDEKGNSEVDPMSQSAVTRELNILDQKILEEKNRAESAEQDLQGQITNEKNRAEGIEQDLQEQITNEKDRAEAAEQNLEEEITNEQNRAESAEQDLQGQITNEKNRAEGIEQNLEELITNEQSRAEGIEQDLQEQINAIVSGGAKVHLYTRNISDEDISAIFVNEETTIRVVGESSVEATSIVLKRDDTTILSDTDTSLVTKDDSVIVASPSNIKYDAIFTIFGATKSVYKNVSVVYPIYFGAADAYISLIDNSHRASARVSPAGTYIITIPTPDYKYIWFIIPATMSINAAKDAVTGFGFSLLTPEIQTIDGVDYKVYRTPNTQEPGTYKVELF